MVDWEKNKVNAKGKEGNSGTETVNIHMRIIHNEEIYLCPRFGCFFSAALERVNKKKCIYTQNELFSLKLVKGSDWFKYARARVIVTIIMLTKWWKEIEKDQHTQHTQNQMAKTSENWTESSPNWLRQIGRKRKWSFKLIIMIIGTMPNKCWCSMLFDFYCASSWDDDDIDDDDDHAHFQHQPTVTQIHT